MIERAVRGRKTLGHDRPAGRSPKRQVTVPADFDARILAFIAAGGARDFSPWPAPPWMSTWTATTSRHDQRP